MTINFEKNIVVQTITEDLKSDIYIRYYHKNDFAVCLNGSTLNIFRHNEDGDATETKEIDNVCDIYVDIEEEFIKYCYSPLACVDNVYILD